MAGGAPETTSEQRWAYAMRDPRAKARERLGRSVHTDQGPGRHRRPHRRLVPRPRLHLLVHPRRQPRAGDHRPGTHERGQRHHVGEQPCSRPNGECRGYLLTQEASFQQYYGQAHARIPAELAQLVTVATDSSAVRQSAAAIQRDTDQLMFEMAQLSQQPAGPTLSPVAHTLLLYSQGETDRLYADIGALTRHESAVVVDERAAIHTSNVVLPLIAIVAVLLAVAAGVGMSQLSHRGVVTRLRRLREGHRPARRGVVPDEVPTGRDEIGRLGARLVDAAAQLEAAGGRTRTGPAASSTTSSRPAPSSRCATTWRRAPVLLRQPEHRGDARRRRRRGRWPTSMPYAALPPRGAVPELRHAGGRRRRGGRPAAPDPAAIRRDPSSEDWREAEGVYNVESGPDGGFQGVVAYLIDVSERHAAQRAAQERRFLLESIFHASPTPSWCATSTAASCSRARPWPR